ncbi:hypothetical protein [Kaistella carnis]|uniref:hypothetical protein n=1 Tax=Kaistella carnis TaxID=1241979 RepID=UPI00289E5712|nr:hypothetical protein [Kaistella carnis]
MEDQSNYIVKSELTDNEQKEKMLLDLYYLKTKITSLKNDKKESAELKKIITDIEKDLEIIFQINIPLKTKKDYINLKNSKFDPDLLRLSKYLK